MSEISLDDLNILEMEPVYRYEMFADAEDDVTVEIPGYFKGEPLVRKFFYDGGAHGILVRNKHQVIICDYVHPGVRQLLASKKDIYISEIDTGREYMAEVVPAETLRTACRGMDLHPYRFMEHPFPMIDGTLNLGEFKCEFCGKKRGYYYKGLLGPNDVDRDPAEPQKICPKCVCEGKADMFLNLERHYRSLASVDFLNKNLPFYDRGKPSSFWGIHCYKFGIYLGELEPEDLTPRLRERIVKNWEQLFGWWNDFEPEKVLGDFEKGRLNAYLFKCSECGEIFCCFNEYLPVKK